MGVLYILRIMDIDNDTILEIASEIIVRWTSMLTEKNNSLREASPLAKQFGCNSYQIYYILYTVAATAAHTCHRIVQFLIQNTAIFI